MEEHDEHREQEDQKSVLVRITASEPPETALPDLDEAITEPVAPVAPVLPDQAIAEPQETALPDLDQAIAEPDGGGAPFARTPFYNETIKRRRPKSGGFKRVLAVAALVCVLGGGSLGVGLGVGAAVAFDVLIPAIHEDAEGDTAAADFSFDGSATAAAEATEEASVPAVSAFSDETRSLGAAVSYADVINQVEPSVVCLTSEIAAQESMFGVELPRSGSGSGILFHESENKYYVVTNYHVIQDSNAVSVSIMESDPIPASLVGSDQHNDLAVIAIDKAAAAEAGVQTVALATFGDSEKMQVGDAVLAIGNALGEGNIATNGIVSAKNKSIAIQQGLSLTVLQTNAAINPGNSGGPLVNLNGEVIGINTAKISETNTEGMGYSIPSNIAKPIIEDFMASMNRPYIGVQITTLDSETAAQYNLLSAGALVAEVVPGSPAEKAGIREMDIITGLNGDPILTAEQLTDAVAQCEIGESVELKLIRDGAQNMTLRLELEQRQ